MKKIKNILMSLLVINASRINAARLDIVIPDNNEVTKYYYLENYWLVPTIFGIGIIVILLKSNMSLLKKIIFCSIDFILIIIALIMLSRI